jgi:hypothetical protein
MNSRTPKKHDVVALLLDLPEYGLVPGDTGAVVHCYDQANAYEVEFVDAHGATRAVVTLQGHQILKLNLAPFTAP